MILIWILILNIYYSFMLNYKYMFSVLDTFYID